MKDIQNTYLSISEKIAYAAGDVAVNFFFKFFQFFLFYYYTDSVGLSAGVVGSIFLLSRLLDMVTDPAMGAIADRTKSRWGSYRPYLLFVAIPYGVCGYLMFLNPDLSNEGKIIYAFVTYSLMMLAFTAINIPYASLSGVMTPSSYERTTLSGYRFVGAFSGGLLLTLLIRPLVSALGADNEAEGFRLTMALFAIISIILFWCTFLFCKERVKPALEHKPTIKKDINSLLKNRPWQLLTLSYIVHGIYFTINGAVTLHFFKYWIGDDGTAVLGPFDLSTLFLAVGLLFSVIGAAVPKFLSAHIDKRMLVIYAALVNCIIMASFYFIKDSSLTLLFVFQAINGIAVGFIPVLQWSMYADTADYGEYKHHHRNTGVIFSAALFGLKLGLAVGGALAGWILAAYGFVGNVAQDEQAKLGILLCFSLIPALLAFLKVVIMYFYPLRDKTMLEIEMALVERKGELHAPNA
ncbi:sugar (glycoside-Pentoside-hexuronide) transporter [Catenovulum agarivorans DS-2]|uniref:Sugar (Glycoside-Pentoside-hexuronide) transporter n=1 Tax=Catenovulum agarivorans DS-2 TaxID=1328313 RepID=W7QMR5_9ALTE|nr:MFS transporter [Catenovulum agarivorans]EWH10237.1 sugar (glycoside-Pentoside-hexuronide) transporter [Catenovulum agarivorans DS-2]